MSSKSKLSRHTGQKSEEQAYCELHDKILLAFSCCAQICFQGFQSSRVFYTHCACRWRSYLRCCVCSMKHCAASFTQDGKNRHTSAIIHNFEVAITTMHTSKTQEQNINIVVCLFVTQAASSRRQLHNKKDIHKSECNMALNGIFTACLKLSIISLKMNK